MATTPRKGLPEFWVTVLAKALSGDQPCLLSTWMHGYFKLDKSTTDQASMSVWRANHSAQLAEEVQKCRDVGWKCSVERYFRVQGQTAIITGKVDLILQKPDERPIIADVKSGQPRDSDLAQVMIEQVSIPLAWKSPHMQFSGAVVYPTHTTRLTADDANALRPRLFELLKKLGSIPRPEASPSESACRFCPVSVTDCPDRMGESQASPVVHTSLF